MTTITPRQHVHIINNSYLQLLFIIIIYNYYLQLLFTIIIYIYIYL